MANQLNPGNYMKINRVKETINIKFNRPTLVEIIEKYCEVHQGEFDVYYNTNDLKSVMMSDFFKELECEVITHVIL